MTHSARCTGDVYPLFNPRLLSNPRQLCHLAYTTTAGGVAVEREAGVVWFEITGAGRS